VETTFEQVKKVISNYTDFSEDEIKEESRLTSDLGLTSFDLVCLSISVEDNFGIKLESKDFVAINTIKDLCNAINRYKGEAV